MYRITSRRTRAPGMLAVLTLSLFVGPALAGKAYKWVDEQGNVTYQDQPPPVGASEVEETELADEVAAGAGSIEEIAERHPITLYVISDCTACDAARSYLKKRQVPFIEKNVENNPALQEEMKKRVGALMVPTIVVGEKVMKGYIESLLEGELDAVGYPRPEAQAAQTAPAEE